MPLTAGGEVIGTQVELILYGYAVGKSANPRGLRSSIGPIFTHGQWRKEWKPTAEVYSPSKTTYVSHPIQNKIMVEQYYCGPRSSWFTVASEVWSNVLRWQRLDNDAWLETPTVDGPRICYSDHVDWNSLLEAVKQSEAEQIWVDHGYSRWLQTSKRNRLSGSFH